MTHLSVPQQQFLKAIHLLAAGLWLSCVLLLGLLPLVGKTMKSGDEVLAYVKMYHFIDMSVLTPAAILTFLTGLVYSLFTPWGFIRHGWIAIKWVISLFIIITGTFYLGPMVEDLLKIAQLNGAAALQNAEYIRGMMIGRHAAEINSTLLILAVFLSTFKPWKNIRS